MYSKYYITDISRVNRFLTFIKLKKITKNWIRNIIDCKIKFSRINNGTGAFYMNRETIPLFKRKTDIAIIVFYLFNLLFISYLFDLEQVVVANASNFIYPFWPPRAVVDLVHWYGRTFDPLLFARPVWWKMTIWMDVIIFGPYYIAAIYAFFRGREWIRIPAVIVSAMLITNVIIILGEEAWGTYPAPIYIMVLSANLPWFLFPVIIILRMALIEHPFTREKA